jgi:allantoate deiminase
LRAANIALPFHIEIAGFSDEEGVRYQTTYLGSRALAGTLSRTDLDRIEEKGLARARRKRGEFLAYAEVHIEQGPILESRNLAVGVVSAIAGQSRLRVEFHGRAGHAGTTPMALRHDALCGAAELALAAEKCGVLATVGQLTVEPGASNVIPGHATLTLDVRHPRDASLRQAVRALHTKAREIARRRGLRLTWTPVQETAAVTCDAALTRLMKTAVGLHEREVLVLPSGAGHDAAALSAICPVTMLFVRCQGGISHHPAESVKTADVQRAIAVLIDFIHLLATNRNP